MTWKVALCVVVFIHYITSSNAVLKRHQRVHAISTFQSKKGPIGPPRPRNQVQRQGNEEDDYYEYYDESEALASTTQKSLTIEEAVRKLTAKPPGFGPPQIVSTKHPLDRTVVQSPKGNSVQRPVDGSFEFHPLRTQQTSSQFVATTIIPKSASQSSGEARTSVAAPPLNHPPLATIHFIGPLNFVQPDQPFLVGRNVVVRSGKEINSLRGKFASLPSLPSNNVFLNPMQLPVALPSINPSSFQPKFETIQPSESFRTIGSDNSLPKYPLNNVPFSDRTEQTYKTTTDKMFIDEETGKPFFLNNRQAFRVISIPSNDFRVSEQTELPQRTFSVTTSVQLDERPLQVENKHSTTQTSALLSSSTSSSNVMPSKTTISTEHLKNISTTSVAPRTDDKMLPNGVLAFTEADFSQAFRVGHNIVRVKLNTEETTTSPLSTTSMHTKHQIRSTHLVPITAMKKIDLPETSEFSESPFSYYDGPQKPAPAPVREKNAKKPTVGATRVVPLKDSAYKDRSAKYDEIRPNEVSAQGTSRIYPKQSSTTKPSTPFIAQQLRGETKSKVEFPSKHTAATEPSSVKPEHYATLQPPSAFVVGSPSLYGEQPAGTDVKSMANVYGEPENGLQTSDTFVDGHRTFRIDARRMRKILDEYLPKSMPADGTPNTVTENFAQNAFSESQRNKLIEGIISAIESVQKFSESIRREMRQVLRDSFIPNLTHERFPKSNRFASMLSSMSKLIPSKSVESNATSNSLIRPSRTDFKVVSVTDNSLASATTRTDRVDTTEAVTRKNAAIWNTLAMERLVQPKELRSVRQ